MEVKIFGIRAKLCKSFLSKARGLMFTKKRNAKPLLFAFPREQIIPIHMFFVFFPIKATYLNKDKKVVDQKILKPFQCWTSRKKAKYILEIPL